MPESLRNPLKPKRKPKGPKENLKKHMKSLGILRNLKETRKLKSIEEP